MVRWVVCAITFPVAIAPWSFAEESSAPALPPGLGGESSAEAPPLPPGLGGESSAEAPSLPPGLGDTPTEDPGEPEERPGLPIPLHGFFELRGGLRTQTDPANSKTATIGEGRLQLKMEKAWDRAVIEVTADFVGDAVLEEGDFDLRQARLSWNVSDNIDLRIGRQVLTWGTGDLLFINDLFPKDWQSFFIGRDVDYLKAPSDALRVGCYPGFVNVDFVYTPQFDPDRYITGERISYYDPMFDRHKGSDDPFSKNRPNRWFVDDEFALRLYRSVGKFEVALYGYWGFWKSPGGMQLLPPAAAFPRLNVYGASLRGPLGKGIAHLEVGYYDSRDDGSGGDPFVNNSEFRLLAGYEWEAAQEFTVGIQYYLEHMMDYDAYRASQPFWSPARDESRSLFTLRLTKLLLNQNLVLSWFMFYSPTDNDAYLRPVVQYQIDDHWSVEAGGNIFVGESNTTFFGQFENNTNVYANVRYAF